MNLQLTGKLALVTASAGGIGREIARSLAREGATVIINGRSAASVGAALADIRASLPDARLLPLGADSFPDLDILVNNLGIYEAVEFLDETDEAWQRLFEVNIMSGVRVARPTAVHWRAITSA